MIIENGKMLLAFSQEDAVRYYNSCVDIFLAGGEYKVKKITFFAKSEEKPLSDYIQVKEYDDNFLLLGVYTEDEKLVSECMEFVDTIKDNYTELELRTDFFSVLDMESVKKRFSYETPEVPASPVYYIHTRKELAHFLLKEGVSISLSTEKDKEEIKILAKSGMLDPECMGEGMFNRCTCFSDVKWYILRVHGNIAGYLRAECGYQNIYDIGWLFVEPRYRCNGYAKQLVLYFSNHMFDIGAIPHYGFAICDESVAVAEKCGFKCDKIKTCGVSLKKL